MSETTKEVKKEKNRLSEDVAREQMQTLMDSYDIDQNDIVLDQGPEAIDTIINRLVRAIRVGTIEVLAGGSVKHNLTVPAGDVQEITYRRMNGRALHSRDKASKAFEKDCALMGSLCNLPSGEMAKLDIQDISIFQRLAVLFTVA